MRQIRNLHPAVAHEASYSGGSRILSLAASAARRSWMRGFALAAAHPLTQQRLANKCASLRNPLPMGQGIQE